MQAARAWPSGSAQVTGQKERPPSEGKRGATELVLKAPLPCD